MPDVVLIVRDISDADEAEKLERALTRLDFVQLVNVDPEKGLVAVSYKGGVTELEKLTSATKEAGHDVELTPGAEHAAD